MDDDRGIKPVYIGDRITVQTIRGIKGNVISRVPDGRAVLFDRNSPYRSMLGPNQLVECNVIHVSKTYVIVDPIREPEPVKGEEKPTSESKPIEKLEPPELYKARLLENLRRLSEKGELGMSTFAGALLHIIEGLDASKAPSQKRSPINTDGMVEEQHVEHPPDSPASDEFIRATSSFGLTQPYLDGYQEEEKTEVEAPLSIRIEDFGPVGDLPKDVRLLTVGQTKYLKEHHLRGLDGYDAIDRFTTFFSEASALERREYGNVFYASMGADPWHKVYRLTVERHARKPPMENF